MANKTETKEVSKGICNFCKGEFEKAKMTQHLKYCKQRAAEIATEIGNTSAPQKIKLFHLSPWICYPKIFFLNLRSLSLSMTLLLI
jgi:hypothetical protein